MADSGVRNPNGKPQVTGIPVPVRTVTPQAGPTGHPQLGKSPATIQAGASEGSTQAREPRS